MEILQGLLSRDGGHVAVVGLERASASGGVPCWALSCKFARSPIGWGWGGPAAGRPSVVDVLTSGCL